MKEEELDRLFKELQGSFDTEEPARGHQGRFEHKLRKLNDPDQTEHAGLRSRWQIWAVAASMALLLGLGFGLLQGTPSMEEQVAEISPEISKTEFYFANLIEEQVMLLEKENSPETRQLVEDTLRQLDKLEKDYGRLERDLLDGGNHKLILSAMITNFQTRIDLLQEVLEKIENIKNLNPYNDENHTI